MTEDPDNAFMKGKEEIVLQHVKFLTEMLELKTIPRVEFCDGFTPMGQDALACIDTGTWTIYISRIYLGKMDIAEVKETIAHEITHLFEPSHEPRFQQMLNDLKTGTWKPDSSSGMIMIDGSSGTEKTDDKPTKKEKPDKTRCNYHRCRQKAELKRCVHCRRYFCEEHYKPTPPSMPNFDYPNKFNEWKGVWEKHHPCANYYDYLLRKEKERTEKTIESLDGMSRFRGSYEIEMESVELIGFGVKEEKAEMESDVKEEKVKVDKDLVGPMESDVKEEKEEVEIEFKKTCTDCGEEVGVLAERFLTDSETGEKIRLCPGCLYKRQYSKGKIIDMESDVKEGKKSFWKRFKRG